MLRWWWKEILRIFSQKDEFRPCSLDNFFYCHALALEIGCKWDKSKWNAVGKLWGDFEKYRVSQKKVWSIWSSVQETYFSCISISINLKFTILGKFNHLSPPIKIFLVHIYSNVYNIFHKFYIFCRPPYDKICTGNPRGCAAISELSTFQTFPNLGRIWSNSRI